MNTLYVDLRGKSKDIILKNLRAFLQNLENRNFDIQPSKFSFQEAENKVRSKKLEEFFGKSVPYSFAEFSSSFSGEDTLLILNTCLRFTPSSFLTKKIFERVRYNKRGIIVAHPQSCFRGKNILHYFFCYIKQDVACVLLRKENFLEYVLDVSVFEKTPKDPSGKNQYLGQDLVQFHSKNKTFGKELGRIIQKIFLAFQSGGLELLIVDLHGIPFVTKSGRKIRRFERDYFVPVKNKKNVVCGVLAAADVFFQSSEESLSPYEGGVYFQGIETQTDIINEDFIPEKCFLYE
ncbi:hypothetical protein K9M59_01105 [Candidatus Gracilibacteria bacterium]|nr:hypothetical protein [Candidatus Gracilibacteria bacterium]MCF7819166.1 hypothetical protein [Candidatus Gracilibacteria bacterium]